MKMIVFGLRKRTPILSHIIEQPTLHKTSVALIANPTAATLEKRATWNLNCIVHGNSSFDSYTSVMSVLADSPTALARLRSIESTHQQLGELSSS